MFCAAAARCCSARELTALMTLVPAYHGRLPQPVVPGLVSVGRFDGRSDTLVCAATAGKLMLLNPSQQKQLQQQRSVAMETDGGLIVQTLNIEQPVLSLCTGQLLDDGRDALVVGTATDILVYDVDRNADLFHRSVPDGAYAVVVGRVGGQSAKPVAVAGGNCTLLGFDRDGAEAFWSVTGDRVTAMAAGRFQGVVDAEDGDLLLVGSEDFELRLFREDAIAREFTETDAPIALLTLPGARFAYALANGTIGVYERAVRLWRIKSKHRPVSLAAFDLDSDGQLELLVGWSGGKVDARRVATGQVVFRDQGPSPVAGLAVADLRGDGRPPLLTIVGTEGDIRAFEAVPYHLAAELLSATLGEDAAGSVRALMLAKQSLSLELRNYENNRAAATDGNQAMHRRSGSGVSLGGTLRIAMGTGGDLAVIPANTQLSTCLTVETDAVVLRVATSNETVVRALAVFAEGLFEDGESLVAHPPASQVGSQLALAITPMRNSAVDLHIKCLVSHRGSAQFHVFEASRLLPRFAAFAWLGGQEAATIPSGWVRFRLLERPQRLAMWVNNNFLLPPSVTESGGAGGADGGGLPAFRFRCVRTGRLLTIGISGDSVKVDVDSLELAAEVVASLAEFLGLDDLSSEAQFPELVKQLEDLALRVRQLEAGQARLAADQANGAGLVRGLAVRAEDSRLLGDLSNTRRAYADLIRINRDLAASHRARADAHASLVGVLKLVGLVIQQGAALRTGRYRTQVVSQCRSAVQSREFGVIYHVICTGSA